jgi:hypothetical protein
MQIQSLNSPWDLDQNNDEPQREQNDRSTDSEEGYAVSTSSPWTIRSARRGTLPKEANSAPCALRHWLQ